MRDPSLSPDLFERDRVLLRETVLDVQDFACLPGAVLHAEGVFFSASPRLVLRVPAAVERLSRFNRLSLQVKNCVHDTLLVGVRLIRGSTDASGAPAMSFTGGREELPPGVWKTLRFPAESFGTYGTSTDWTGMESLEIFFGFDRTHSGLPEVRIAVRSLEGEFRDIPKGPRLTRKGLTEVLSPAAPEGDASAKGSLPRKRIFTETASGLYVPPPHPYPQETADEVLAGNIMGQHLGEPIPWLANPLGVQEWTHFLNRHHFMRALVVALRETGDGRYAAGLASQICSWIHDNPVPVDSDGGAGPAWETLSAAWRLREWTWVRRIAWPFRAFGPEERLLMLRSVWEHACHVMDHKGHPNNWIMVESCALVLAGLWFPEFKEADRWVETGVERLRSECTRQFFQDGAHFEISPLYHAICVHAMLDVKCAAAAHEVALPEEFDSPLDRCFSYLAALCRPDFTWPSLNDSGSVDGDYTALMSMAGEAFNRPDLRWLGTRGHVGSPPERTSYVFPDAGVAAMRSAHGSDANFLVFRAGPAGAAHAHDDAMSLDVTALGVTRLVDPGITTYAPDALSHYYRSAQAHNTLLIDGNGPNPAGATFHQRIQPAGDRFAWRAQGSLHTAFGMFRGPWSGNVENVTFHRAVMFVRGEYWIVRDAVFSEQAHEITTCWQFFPARVQVDPETLRSRVADARGPRFELIPVPGTNSWEVEVRAGGFSPPVGWTSQGGKDVPSFTVRYRSTSSPAYEQEWILLPYRGRTVSGIEVTRSRQDNGTTLLEISFPDGRTDTVTMGPFPPAGGEDMSPPAVSVETRAARHGINGSRQL